MHVPKLQGYLTETWYLTALPEYLNTFRKSEPSINLFLTYGEEKECCYFTEKGDKGHPVNREVTLGIQRYKLSSHENKNIWLRRDYHSLLEDYAEQWGISKSEFLCILVN